MDNLEEMDSLEEMDKLLEKYNIKNSTRRNRKCEESNHKDRNQNVVKKKNSNKQIPRDRCLHRKILPKI